MAGKTSPEDEALPATSYRSRHILSQPNFIAT